MAQARVPNATALQRYRMRTPSTGPEVTIEAEPGRIYRYRETGEELQVTGIVLPLAPSTATPQNTGGSATPTTPSSTGGTTTTPSSTGGTGGADFNQFCQQNPGAC